ncbi:MAG: hypothetical protein ABI978_05205, partial [Chloroflexota bacterium]
AADPSAAGRRFAPQFWQNATPARLWVPQRGHAWVPSGGTGRSTAAGAPGAINRCPQLRQKAIPGRFSVPQRGHCVPSINGVAGTECAAISSGLGGGGGGGTTQASASLGTIAD